MQIIRNKIKILNQEKEQVELIADNGCVITQKVLEEGEEPIYSDHLFLSFQSTPNDWVEIREEEMPRLNNLD